MEYRPLGNTGKKISAVGFGCMSLQPENDNETLLRTAEDNGINYFDTADIYDKGINEEIVGRALQPIRQHIMIATKVGNVWKPDGSGLEWKASKPHILKSIDDSLRRLQTDYIDVYQLHGGTMEDPIDEVVEAFELLVQQGKILHYGISSIRPGVIREYVNRSRISTVMLQYSLLDRRPEEAVLELLQQKGIGVLARGALAQGLLINKPPKAYLGHTVEEITAAQELVNGLATEHVTPAAIALGYVWQQPAICGAVCGIRTAEQLQEALQAAGAEITETLVQNLRLSVPAKTYENYR